MYQDSLELSPVRYKYVLKLATGTKWS